MGSMRGGMWGGNVQNPCDARSTHDNVVLKARHAKHGGLHQSELPWTSKLHHEVIAEQVPYVGTRGVLCPCVDSVDPYHPTVPVPCVHVHYLVVLVVAPRVIWMACPGPSTVEPTTPILVLCHSRGHR